MRTRRLLADLIRGRWNETTAGRVLGAWRGSAMSMSSFARTHGVNAQRLSWWRKRLGDKTNVVAPTVAPLAFIPAAVSGSARVALRLPGGVELEGDAAAIPAEWVAALARALGRA
jgi:transposase-like protein